MFGEPRRSPSWSLLPKSVRILLGFLGIVGGLALLYVLLDLLPRKYPATWTGCLLAILVAIPFLSGHAVQKLRKEHATLDSIPLSERLHDFKKARALFLSVEISAAVLLFLGIDNAREPFAKFHVAPSKYGIYYGLHFAKNNGVLDFLINGAQLWSSILSIAGVALTYNQFAKPISAMESEEFQRKIESGERLF